MEKIAIIDLGSNTARMILVDILSEGHFVITDQLKETPRIGEGMEKDGFLKQSRISATIDTLKMFRKLCDAYNVEKIIAVATAAVRRAKNQRSFLDEVFASTGIKLRVLSAEEEALLVYKGVINTMDVPKGIIFEIGGGSTKIVYYNRRNLLNYATLPFGSIMLTEMFAGLSPEEQSEKIEEYVTEQLTGIEWLKDIDPETQLIGVGGSVRNLCRITKIMKKYPLRLIHNYVVTSEDFEHTYGLLRTLDIDRKKRIKGISSGRADILPSAFAAIAAFKKYTERDNIIVSSSGLRTGLIFNYSVPTTVDKPISDVLTFSLASLAELYHCEKQHTDNVVNLSIQLFKQLRVLHKFPRQYLRILKVAAYLHESGKAVQYYNYPKHSGYIIRNAAINGLSHRDIVLASFVTANTTMEDINAADWARYSCFLTEEDVEVVKKMGTILRIAEALDRSRTGVVTGINCDILGDSVIMKTELAGEAELELASAVELAPDFRRVFKKNLEIL